MSICNALEYFVIMLARVMCFLLQILYFGFIIPKCYRFCGFIRTVSFNIISFTVSKPWGAKKNAVEKEKVAKLVDDTYRFAFCIMYFFHDLIGNVIDGLESTDTAFVLLCPCPTCTGHGKRVGHGFMRVPAICFC